MLKISQLTMSMRKAVLDTSKSLLDKRFLQTSRSSAAEKYNIGLISSKSKKKVNKVGHNLRHTQDDIINLRIPHSIKSSSDSHTQKSIYEINKNLNNLEVKINKKFDEFENVLKVLSTENKQTNSALLNQLKKTSLNDHRKPIDLNITDSTDKTTIRVNREDLEAFLQHAKMDKDRKEEEYFRVVRALESSMPRSRSLEQKNFFTPINENLINKLTKRGTFPTLEQNQGHDDLLFPTIPKHDENKIHEFMILSPTDSNPIITTSDPLELDYHKPDLVTMIQKLGTHHDQYWSKILKYEKEKWNLIAIEGYEDQSVLIFERNITKQELNKLQRNKWYIIAYSIATAGAVLYLLGSYFEKTERKPLIKKTVET